MKKTLPILALIALTLSSCARGCQSAERSWQSSDRSYEITVYSGGDTVFVDKLDGIINQEEKSDGIFYYHGDTLIEISGDYILKSLDK